MSDWTPEKMAYKKKYTKAQKIAYAKRMARKRKPKRNFRKPYQMSVRQRIAQPLMPKTRLAKLKYTTRIQLDPAPIASSQVHDSTSANVAIHSFILNDIHDPDYTSTVSNSLQHDLDGSRDHQPRMHDQWAQFYNYKTVVSAKVRCDFITREKAVMINTNHGAGDSAVTAIPCIKAPEPCAVGYLDSEFDQTSSVSVKLDDILEKNQCKYRKTHQRPSTYTMIKYWSLKKDPLYKTELINKSGNGSDVGWGSAFGAMTDANNRRYFHLFAHGLTTTDNVDPMPIDVLVQMEQIVLLSDLKDVGQS